MRAGTLVVSHSDLEMRWSREDANDVWWPDDADTVGHVPETSIIKSFKPWKTCVARVSIASEVLSFAHGARYFSYLLR